MLPRGGDPGGMASFSLSEIFKFELQRPKQFPHKIIIWNSFCYKGLGLLKKKKKKKKKKYMCESLFSWREEVVTSFPFVNVLVGERFFVIF